METAAVRGGAVLSRSVLAGMKHAFVIASGAAAAVGAGFAVTRLDAGRDALVLGAMGAVLLAPVAIRIAQGRFDPFEPTVVFALAFGTMFVIRPFAMLVNGDFVYERPSGTIAVDDTFSEMAVLAAAGAFAFVAAYALPLGRGVAARLMAPRGAFNTGRVVRGALATAGGGIALTALFVAGTGESLGLLLAGRSVRLTDALRSSSAYLAHGPYLLVPSALMLFAVGRAHARRGLVIAAGTIAGVLLLLTVPVGGRMLLLPFAGGTLIYYYVSRNSRPRLVTLVALLFASLFASSLLLDLRTAGYGQSEGFRETASSTLRRPVQTLAPLTSGPDAEMAPALAATLTVVPEELGFMHGGATVGDLFTRPIPRELWSEKPLSPRETIISRLWPMEYSDHVANPEFSVLLYFYLDFALLGVIIGMATYGVIARVVYEYFRAHRQNLGAQLMFSLSVPFVVIALRDSPVDTGVRAVFIIAPLLLVFGFAARRSPRRPEVSREI